jgi:hypothetical protein
MSLPSDDKEAAALIHQMYLERKRDMAKHLDAMNAVRQIYHNEINLPLPELDKLEKPAIPNLVALGIDQTAMRVGSVLPDIIYPSERPGFQWADNKARESRLANLGWWRANRFALKIPRRARHLITYGTSPVTIFPVSTDINDKRAIPHWRVRNPMGTFPAPTEDWDSVEPMDCIFSDIRTFGWLLQNYPSQASVLQKPENPNPSDIYWVLEYVDDEETATIVLGQKREGQSSAFGGEARQVGAPHAMLSRIRNRAGICPVVYPKRIALDGMVGQFNSMIGMYIASAKLFALNQIAVERDIFKDEWVVGNVPNQAPQIIQQADGRMGVVGLIHNGDVKSIGSPPGALTQQTNDALERSQRLSAGIPAEFGGESPSNVRTARRGADVLGSSIDGVIGECQAVLAASMEAENRRAVAIQKAYYGKRKSVFFGERYDGKEPDKADYIPNETFVREDCEVKYAIPGTDMPGLVVQLGQMIGDGTLSAQSAQEMNPLITDPIKERDRIEVEGLRRSLLQSLEQGASNGTVAPQQIAMIAKMKSERHVPIEDAVIAIHEQEQQKQAAAQTPPGMPGQQQPPMGPAPEAQPGLGSAQENAMTMQGGAPAVAPPQQSQQDLGALLTSLRKSNTVPAAEQQMSGQEAMTGA